MPAFGLHGKVLVVGEAAGVASVRRDQELPPCRTEPVLAGSKMDPLLAKAEPISDGGSTSVIAYLEGEKKLLHSSSQREE